VALYSLIFEMINMVLAGRCANPGVARTGTLPLMNLSFEKQPRFSASKYLNSSMFDQCRFSYAFLLLSVLSHDHVDDF
jgi:hypothetical protein